MGEEKENQGSNEHLGQKHIQSLKLSYSMVLLAQHPFCLAKWPWGLYTDASPSCKPTASQQK